MSDKNIKLSPEQRKRAASIKATVEELEGNKAERTVTLSTFAVADLRTRYPGLELDKAIERVLERLSVFEEVVSNGND